VGIGEDDPEMAAAFAKARQTLPQFWQVFDKREHGESNFVLVVRITDEGRIEHFFTTDYERHDGKTMVTISNIVASVKLGDRIEIPEADITDWQYMRDGKFVGLVTFKVRLKGRIHWLRLGDIWPSGGVFLGPTGTVLRNRP
jgi:uncharacterized protein YegJ (DUF2314 family)